MRITAPAWIALWAGRTAAALQVPLAFYASSDCGATGFDPINGMHAAASSEGNVSECIVTPGMVSVHLSLVLCNSGASVKPYFFQDTGCNTPIDKAASPIGSGDDLRCFTVDPSMVAALMLSCSANETSLETPNATETPFSTLTAAASTWLLPSATGQWSYSDAGNSSDTGPGSPSSTARTGILVGCFVVGTLLGRVGCCCLCRMARRDNAAQEQQRVAREWQRILRWHPVARPARDVLQRHVEPQLRVEQRPTAELEPPPPCVEEMPPTYVEEMPPTYVEEIPPPYGELQPTSQSERSARKSVAQSITGLC